MGEGVKQVWKYPALQREPHQIPVGARFLSMGWQRGDVCAWFLVDPAQPREPRRIHLIPTGEVFDDRGLEYLNTVLMGEPPGSLVWHVFITRGSPTITPV